MLVVNIERWVTTEMCHPVELCDMGLPAFMEEHKWRLIESKNVLLSELQRLGKMDPHKVQIRCQETRFLSFGIGGAWMAISVYPAGVQNDSLLFLPPEVRTDSPLVFLFQGIPDAFPAKYLVPFDDGVKLISCLAYEKEIPNGFVNTREQRIQDEQLIKEARKSLIPDPEF